MWLSAAAVLAYFCRNSVGVAESTIRAQLKLSESEMGWFLGAFFWSYALFQVPAGYLGQRLGTRIVLGWSGITWSLGIILLGGASNLTMLIAAQLLMGLAQAAVFPCAVQSISVWIPESKRATACSALSIGMQIGAIITASLTGILITRQDWRLVFMGYAVPGVLWAIGFLANFRNHPAQHPAVNPAEYELINPQPLEYAAEAKKSPAMPWLTIMSNRSILCLCGQQMFRAAGYAFFSLWFPTFLQETRGIKVAESGYLQTTVFMATLLGGLAGGLVVDAIYHRTKNLRLSRSGVGTVCMLCCSWLIFCAYFANSALMAVALIDLGAFAAALAGSCAYVTTIDIGRKHVPAVFGLMNMSGNLAAAATPVVIGYVFYSTSNWNIVLAVFGAAYLLAAICWWLVDPNQTAEADDNPPEEIP
jgi:MFS transporter, ACS family, D-galactonate transporter